MNSENLDNIIDFNLKDIVYCHGYPDVMNLRDSPSGSNRLLSVLDSITITKVNNIKANSTKYFIKAFTRVWGYTTKTLNS